MTGGPADICRPGFGASCSLCCGSHNYRAGREELEALFALRAELMARYSRDYVVRSMAASRSGMTGSYYFRTGDWPFIAAAPALFEDLPRCPFVGRAEDGVSVGCLLYPGDCRPELRHECFQSYRGKIFSCRARDILSGEEIRYAARLTRDWYYYSVLIYDGELLRRMMGDHPDPDAVPEEEMEEMKRKLEELVAARRDLHGIHSYF
jgi:hypothetical protein